MSIIPIIISSLIFFAICYNSILTNSIAVAQEITNYAANEINRVQEVTTNIAVSLDSSSDVQIAMRYDNLNPDIELISPFQINSSLSLLQKSASSEIVAIYCFNEYGVLYESNTSTTTKTVSLDEDWCQVILSSDEPTWFAPHTTSFITNSPYQNLISYGVPYIDYMTGEANGILLIDINADTVFSNLSMSDTLKSNTYYVLDENENIIFSTEADSVEIDNTAEFFEALSASNFYYSSTLDNGWKVVGAISPSAIVQDTLSQLVLLLLLILIVVIILAVLISIERANQISAPIQTLIDNMNSFHNDLNYTALLIPDSTVEIISLYTSFNIMIERSNEYIAQIKTEQTNLRQANFKALQAQINPHFLYNTMDTIAWNIRLNENEKAIDSIMALTKFFRSSLRKGEDIILVNQEFEQVSLYLEIQLFRYGDMLNYSVDYDSALDTYTIPKLSLQPIVENAIYHGIKNKDGYGHISISVQCNEDSYSILIHDNGLGMTPERLEQINNSLRNNLALDTNEAGGYGLQNVNERIQIYFGAEYGLHYRSVLGEYTEAEVKLPYTTK